MKCEIRWCFSEDHDLISVNENIADQCYRVQICRTCAHILNLTTGMDLPEPDVVERALANACKTQ